MLHSQKKTQKTKKTFNFFSSLLNAAVFARMAVTTALADDVSSITAVETRAETSGTKSGIRSTVGHGSGMN